MTIVLGVCCKCRRPIGGPQVVILGGGEFAYHPECAPTSPVNFGPTVPAPQEVQQAAADTWTQALASERTSDDVIEGAKQWAFGQEVQPSPAAQPEVTPQMVEAYLAANTAYWKRTDELPKPPHKWRTGTAAEATAEGLRAALAASPAAQGLTDTQINQLAREAGLPMSWLDDGKASAWPELHHFARAILSAGAAVPQPAPTRWHELKTDPEPFDAVAAGRKTFEIRRNDRDFQVGDGLLLRRTKFTGAQMRGWPEMFQLSYTGEEFRCVVTHVMRGPVYGLADDWAILSIAPLNQGNP